MAGNAFPSLYGYPASTWAAMRATMVYANTALTTLSGNQAISLAQACAITFKNAMSALDAYAMSIAAARGYSLISAALALPGLSLGTADLTFVQARLAALLSFATTTSRLVAATSFSVGTAPTALFSGTPAVTDCGLLEYLASASVETSPAGLAVATFSSQAQAAAMAWANFYTAAYAAGASGSALDEISYMGMAASTEAAKVAHVALASATSVSSAWNGLVAFPSLTAYSAAGANDPTSAASQQMAVVRVIASQMLYQFCLLVVNLRQIVPANVATYTVRMGDSLMSIAARQLGDYSKWQQIANINGLLPPYFAAVPTPNMVSPGQQLYLPTDGIPANVVPAQGAASYEISFLGYDIFYGALNQDMAPWTGDFVTISGYSNLAFSLGRRLQTPLGNLIYHMDFGSRIPPEVGNILTQDTVGHIGAFAVSAVLSDPRVQQVVSVNAQALTNQGVSVSLVALPKGQTNSSGSGVPVGVSFTPSQIGANPRPTALMDNAGNLLYDTTGNILIGSS